MKQPILVKLKMKSIYKNFLVFLGFLILLLGFMGISYMFYDKMVELDSDIEVNGALSINYVDGKKFNIKTGEHKIIKFSVSNASDKVNYYNIGFTKVRGNGTYKIIYNDIVIMEGKLSTIDELTTDYISIDSNETKIYTLEIQNANDADLKGALNIRNQNGKLITFADIILKNTLPSETSLTKVGVEAATEDEGLIKSSDDSGVSYYYRGNVENNYVSFGGFMWRIIRINGDGTVRIVLDDVAETLATYYNSDNQNFDYELSNIGSFLDNWLEENLKNYTMYIANSKFCNDISKDTDGTMLAYTRVITNKIPTLNCLGNSYSNSIGLMTIDEVLLAGATPTSSNDKFYLYKKDITTPWYTMTGAKGNDNSLNLFMVNTNGELKTDLAGDLYRNVRPVINLIKNIDMIGDGTINNPYTLAN